MEQLQSKTYASVPPHALVLFRILFGIVLIVSWLSILLNVSSLSMVEWLFFGGMLIFSLLLTIGAWMRLVALLLAFIFILQLLPPSFTMYLPAVAEKGQALLFAFLLIMLTMSDADRGFSYTMFRRYGSAREWEDVRARGHILMKSGITIAYLYLGLLPLWQPVWMNGLRLRSALIGSLGTGIAARTARALSIKTLVWIVSPLQAFAIFLPFCLWLRSVQIVFLPLAILFHIVLGLFLGQWWLLVLAAGLPLFLDPETVQRSFEKMYQSQDMKTANS